MDERMVKLVAEGEVAVGKHLGRHEYTITPELVAAYSAGTGDTNPWYYAESPFGGPVAPALIMHKEMFQFDGWYLPNVYGNLHAKQEWELFNPVMVGETIQTAGNVLDRYIKRGRDFVVNEFYVEAADGRLLARSRTHQSFLISQSANGPVVDKQREKTQRGEKVQNPRPVLESLVGSARTVDQQTCWAYSGPHRNYHNDAEMARKLGFPDIVVQGTMSTCFVSELMTERFGEGWYRGGRMALNLINVLWVDEQVTAEAVVHEYTPEGGAQRAHLTVWTQKPDGAKTTVGTASALVF
jgi:acyl dehydratase